MTGKYSVYTLYEGHEIMFHVSTMLPFSRDNRQQVSGHDKLIPLPLDRLAYLVFQRQRKPSNRQDLLNGVFNI